MGIGQDGHTAGIFPGDHGFDFDGDVWVVGYFVPKEVNQYQERVTVTNTYLQTEIAQAIVYAVGEEKYNMRSAYLLAQFRISGAREHLS